ncbi:MAG: hypothetical protein PHR98_02455 [Candidatus Shapirobacteria bacterium]|jgi:hypothetical protein|nr:hypothetical protein [Candidatus Shapirobacteria bacterium]
MISSIKNKLQYALLAIPAFAQENNIDIKPSGFGDEITTMTIGGIISGAISLVLLVVALVFFFVLIMGGLKWVMSGGDQKNVEAARNQITNALIGLAIVFATFAIMKLIEVIFGITILGGIAVPTFNK